MKTQALLFCTFILLNEISSQSITTVTYTGTLTRIDCPAQGSYTLPGWVGPPYTSPLGTTYTLDGSAQFNPDLPTDTLSRLTYADNQRDLLLSNTKMGDAGAYTCSILGQFSAATNRLNVRVLSAEPEITTTVSVDGNGVRATEGQSLTVMCTSKGGNPAPTVVWYKGGITGDELARTSTDTQVGDTYTVTLSYTFSPSRQDDRQQLVCRSYYPTPADTQGSQTKAVTLYLYLKPSHSTISLPVSVVTGNTITATCTTTGSRPAADMSWTYLGQTSTPTGTVTEDSSSQTFTVRKEFQRTVTAADNGQTLQCTVNNTALTSPLTESKTLDVQFPVERSSTIIRGNTHIEANGVNLLSLTCTTGSSNPASDITWRNGSDIISNTNGYTVTSGANNGQVRSQILTLRPTRHDDGDTITCSVSGVLQLTDTTNVVLNLQYSPVIADMSDMNVIEGDQAILKCNGSSKPVASFTWTKGSATVAQGTGTASYNGYDYTISTVDRAQAGTYTCTADNQLSQTDSEQTTLTVLYPPDMDVIAANTTVNSVATTVTCDPSGVPDQYTYQRWVHTWNGQRVTHPVPLPTTRVLTLTDLSYAHSGVYTCGASNGVKGVSQGSGSLLVKSFPVLVGVAAETKELKTSGQLHKPITAKFQYFSNAGKGSVKVYWAYGTIEEVGTVSYRDVAVRLPVFGSRITTTGTEAIINITVNEESRFGRYEVRVTNDVDTMTLALVIQTLGPPEPPLFVNVTVLDHQSVIVTWTSGFPNGLNQTFVIQYSTDNTTWRNISLYGGMSSEQPHSKVISDLASSQSYNVRLLATNEKGESTPTDIFDFITKASFADQEKQSSTGAIAGGAAGGAVSALIIITVVIFVIWRSRKNESSSGEASNTVEDNSSQSYETLSATRNTQSYDTLQQNNHQPHTYENSERTPYESLQPRERNETQTYDQLQDLETQPTVYENLKVTSII